MENYLWLRQYGDGSTYDPSEWVAMNTTTNTRIDLWFRAMYGTDVDWGFFLILNVDQLIVNVDGPN